MCACTPQPHAAHLALLPLRGVWLSTNLVDAPCARAGIPGAKSAATATPENLANVGCLVRATGANQKISCMITAKEHRRFMQSYGNILKVSLDSLKKREKKKAEKRSSASGGAGKST